KGFVQFVGMNLMARVSIDISATLMNRVYANVIRQELAFFDHKSTGELLNTCYREVYGMQELVQMLASRRVVIPLNMLIMFCALMAISLPLSLMLLVLLPLIILPTMMVTRRLRSSLGSELGEESA